ncbi:2-oxoacid:acceptor oxidoreductase family protein [Paludibaculum fermentans]|uniref:2-oxoacid:acceptor oxidoreductase family protein n=2 Tax=Paludibaculum fermentans TaxID=1473598 RepID=A0A7S7NYN9_PALFE|nr:2-oxoacid:acceptor oxidoreductase family protein [Paludibaculum fermentans]
MMLKEIRIAGFGGQGVILAAHILGRAVSIHEGGFATMTQNYGPEARGGAASAALVISDQPVLFPYVSNPEILVVMSQEAFTRYTPDLKEGGVLIVEEDLVRMENVPQHIRVYSIPATRIAEELGKKMVLNVVMVGFFCAITEAVSYDACKKAVVDSVPEKFRKLNLDAFENGFGFGKNLLSKGATRVEDTEPVSVLESAN